MQTQQFKGVASNIRTENGVTHCRYHNTDVVSFDSETVTLRSGGWKTKTTKDRMNQASNQFGMGFKVSQVDFSWWVNLPNGKAVEFTDGMTFKR